MSSRLAYCIVSISPVRTESKDSSEMSTQLLFGEVVSVEEINSPWCKIQTYSDNYTGFVDIKHLHFLTEKEANRWLDGISYEKHFSRLIETPWGKQTIHRASFVPFGTTKDFNIGKDHFKFLDPTTPIHFDSAFSLAMEYLNVPYLWGGKTSVGIDCSGLTQSVFRFFEINLPRDAYQQAEYGMDVDFNDQESGDLAFFTNDKGKIIHVGILDGKGSIVHASGFVRRDPFTKEGIVHSETGLLTHKLFAIKRM